MLNFRRSENLFHRLQARQINHPPPGTQVHGVRRLYENIVPSHTVFEVECPDHTLRRFSHDGQFLVCFSRNAHELVVYRHRWLSYGTRGEEGDEDLRADGPDGAGALPAKAKAFDAHFTQLYCANLAQDSEVICKEFFLCTQSSTHGIFATASPPTSSPAPAPGAVAGVPSMDSITFFLIRLADGHIADRRTYKDDYMNLSHNAGVFLYDDLLAVLSIRYQSIHILQVLESAGQFVDARSIGPHCREDDELVITSQIQEEARFQRQQAAARKARSCASRAPPPSSPFDDYPREEPGARAASRSPGFMHPGGAVLATSPTGLPETAVAWGPPPLSEFPPHGRYSYDQPAAWLGMFGGAATAAAGARARPSGGGGSGRGGELAEEEEQSMGWGGSHSGVRPSLLPPSRGLPLGGGGANGSHTFPTYERMYGASSGGGGGRAGTPEHSGMSNGHLHAHGHRLGGYVGGSGGGGGSASMPPPPPWAASARAGSAASSGGGGGSLRTGGGASSSHRGASVSSGGGGGSGADSGCSRQERRRRRAERGLQAAAVEYVTSSRADAAEITARQLGIIDSEGLPVGGAVSGGGDGGGASASMSTGAGGAAGGGGGPGTSSFSLGGAGGSRGEAPGGAPSHSRGWPPQTHQQHSHHAQGQGQGQAQGPVPEQQQHHHHPPPSGFGPGAPSSAAAAAAAAATAGYSQDVPTRSIFSGSAGPEYSLGGGGGAAPRGAAGGLGGGPPGHERQANGVSAAAAAAGGRGNGDRAAGAGGEGHEGDGAAAAGGGAEGEGGGAQNGEAQSAGGGQLYGGMKQRLLAFIFRGIWEQQQQQGGGDADAAASAQKLKRFYYHFQDYMDLVMWKVQFLDRQHLLIKFGSVEGVLLRSSDSSHQNAFFAVYNVETTTVLGFFQNSSEEFLTFFEKFCDHFRVAPEFPLNMAYMSSVSNNVYAREQLRKQKAACVSSKGGSYAQAVKRTLSLLPFNAQSQCPSAYFDQALFHFDEKLISATDRHKPCMEHPIKFISRRRPNLLKFKINPGLEAGPSDGRVKRVASYVFHPVLPFAISIQQSFMQPSVMNLHLRR